MEQDKLKRSQNIHDKKKWKKKKHPASKCHRAKCFICHSDKLFDIPDRQLMRANSDPSQKDKVKNN